MSETFRLSLGFRNKGFFYNFFIDLLFVLEFISARKSILNLEHIQYFHIALKFL